jgi:hypothetical protein
MLNNYITDNYEWETAIDLSHNQPKDIKNFIFQWIKMRYYVFCATDLPDSLGMWNYYVKGDNYQGYNIQISISDFLNCFAPITNPRVDVFYGKVVYNEKEKVEVLKNIILAVDKKRHDDLKNIKHEEDYDITNQVAMGDLLIYLENFRLFFKDNSFSAEREFRFVIRMPLEYDNSVNNVLKTGYEMKNGIIVPYCELSINKNNTLSGITLSPMLENELAENGLNRFLRDNGYSEKIKLRQSKIPIRY